MEVSNKISKMPLISVITVVYNAEETVAKTIDSVISQTHSSFEYIIIDGDSKDNTKSILSNYNDKIDFFLSEKDNGIYDAMNKALNYAKGEWVIFLNSGDCFTNNNVLMDFLTQIYDLDVDIFFGDIVYPSGKQILQSLEITKNFFFSNTICHQSAFVKRKLFSQIGVFNLNYKIIADRDFFYRAFVNSAKFEYMNSFICIWDPIGFSSKNIIRYNNEIKHFRHLNYSIFDFAYIYLEKKLKLL
jgi:glycosyltransferase involved in cell wall biosynthesis